MKLPVSPRWLLGLLAIPLLGFGYYVMKPAAPTKGSTEARILQFYQEWKGTEYQLGGESKEGIDCSALTQRLYKEVFRVDLPRRVVQQRVEGIKVSPDSLEAGDLIVFRGSLFGRPHIGVYIRKKDFMHASSSKGVTISSLNEKYWKRKFKMARRMLDKRGRLILDTEADDENEKPEKVKAEKEKPEKQKQDKPKPKKKQNKKGGKKTGE
jgi:lipoprotein Spr